MDLTGNGFPDVVAMDTDVGLYWFENDGSGRFTRHVVHERAGEWLERHEIADIDGDGRPEIVSVDNKGSSLLWFSFDGDPRERRSWTHHYITEGGFPGAYDLAVADLDGDGDLDVAATNWRIGNEVAWFENQGDRWVKHTIEEGIGEPRTILAVDFDRDGRIEVVATGWEDAGRVALFKHGGDPRGPWSMQVLKEEWTAADQVILVDFDRDGRLDIVAAAERGSNEVRWWRNLGPA